MKESNFVLQLKKSFAYQQKTNASFESMSLPLFWKLRGSAYNSGRPDILIVQQGFTFFIETKVKELKREGATRDVLAGVTALQRANLHRIVANGGLAYIAVQIESRTAVGVDLKRYFNIYNTMPNNLQFHHVDGNCFSFFFHRQKNFWDVQEFHERNMK